MILQGHQMAVPSYTTFRTQPTIIPGASIAAPSMISVLNPYSNPPLPPHTVINGYNFPEPGNLMNSTVCHYIVLNVTEADERKLLPQQANFANEPTKIVCPRCEKITMTNVLLSSGCATWTWCIALFPFGGAGLCCLCLDSCKDRNHYCPCGQHVGVRKSTVCC